MPFNGDPTIRTGWHELRPHSVAAASFHLDLPDSVIDSTTTQLPLTGDVYVRSDGSGLRLGLARRLSSAGGGGNFDDIYLAQLPEPTTLLLLLSGLALIRRR